jgi:hypothetical protein
MVEVVTIPIFFGVDRSDAPADGVYFPGVLGAADSAIHGMLMNVHPKVA